MTQELSDLNNRVDDTAAQMVSTGLVRWPLRIKLACVAALLIVLTCTPIALIFFNESKQLIIQQANKDLETESTLLSNALEAIARQSVADLKLLSALPATVQMTHSSSNGKPEERATARKEFVDIATQMMQQNRHYESIRLISIDRLKEVVRLINSDNEVFNTLDNQLRALRQSSYIGELAGTPPGQVIFHIDQNRSDREATPIRILTPVVDADKQSLWGYLEINLQIYESYQRITSKENSQLEALIVTDDNRVILKTALFSQLLDVFSSNGSQLDKTSFSHFLNQEKNAIFNVKELNLLNGPFKQTVYLFTRHTSQDQLESLLAFRNRVLVTSAIMATLILLITFLASERLVRPLHQITDAIQDFEHNGVVGQLPLDAKDEVGVLARTFHNAMLRQDSLGKAHLQAANDAKEFSEHMQTILDEAEEGIISIDVKGTMLSFNRSAQHLFGYTEKEVVGKNVNMLMPKAFADEHDQYIQNYLNTGESQIMGKGRELIASRRDGSEFPIHLAISKINTDRGIIFTGFVRDISLNKEFESKQAENLALLEATLESTEDGIMVSDNNGLVLHYNSQFAKIWGITRSILNEVDNQAYESLVSHILSQVSDIKAYKARFEAIRDNPETDSQDTIELQDGRIIERFSWPMHSQNDVNGRVWSYRDITRIKRAEEDLIKAKNEALEALEVKSNFLATMSHEIRTPMNGVLGMLGLLEKQHLSREQYNFVHLAKSSAESLLTIINEILDFSKIESGKIELEKIDFNIHAQLSEFTKSIAYRAQEKNVEFILDVRDVPNHMVVGDPGRLRQVLTNLVGNAIKFTEKGEIELKARMFEDAYQGWILRCEIHDTGIGISEKSMGSLFESFTQADASTTRRYGGSGLGLTIAKSLCELMGGSLTAKSEEGIGSCFTFTVNLAKSTVEQQPLPPLQLKQVPVLVVDDNSTNRRVLRGQLEHWGANVSEAASASCALALIKENQLSDEQDHFRIAVLDMAMPEMDGYQLAEAIRCKPELNNLKLILMTSAHTTQSGEDLASLGFNASFPKPATTEDFRGALSLILDGESGFITSNYLKKYLHIGEEEFDFTHAWPKDCRILLVEDNHINQAVARGELEDLNLSCDIAGNGIEALKALETSQRSNPYSLILMDCQMPEMDGFDATRAIRAGKAGHYYKSVPIVAMTANAMTGDRERCINAGMSDYMPKPIDSETLLHILEKWLLGKTYTEDSLPKETALMTWNRSSALKRVKGKDNRLQMLVKMFLDDMPQRVVQLNESIKQRDFDAVKMTAHTIKGVAGNLSAEQLASIASDIEQLGNQKDSTDLDALWPTFASNYNDVESALKHYMGNDRIQ
ncbi:response regulator [Aurantivibrio plasticivorans]